MHSGFQQRGMNHARRRPTTSHFS